MAATRKPQQQRSRQTVAAIVEAGFIIVAQDGVEALTTRRAAEVSGVSVGTLYEYFANKEAILSAIQDQLADEVVGLIQPLIPELVKKPPREVIRGLLFGFRDLLRRDDDRYLNTVRALGGQFDEDHVQPVRQVLSELAIQYIANNPEFAALPDIPTKNYIIIHGGIATMIQQLSEAKPIISFEQLVEGLADMVGAMLENGLADVEAK